MKRAILAVTVLALVAGGAQAMFIGGGPGDYDTSDAITPSAACWEGGGADPGTELHWRNHPLRLIDGSGLDETGEMHDNAAYTGLPGMHFLTENHPCGNNNGILDLGGSWARFDFDQAYPLTELRIWNHNDFTDRGWRNVGIAYNTGSEWIRLGDVFEIPIATRSADYVGSIVADFGGADATGVIICAVDKPAGGNWGGGNGGLSEVRFYIVPEPATIGLIALGGLALLRRKR